MTTDRVFRTLLMIGAATAAVTTPTSSASAQAQPSITVGSMPLAKALDEIVRQSGKTVTYDPDAVPGRTSAPVSGAPDVLAAVAAAIRGTGLSVQTNPDGVITVVNDIVVTATRDEAELSFRADGAQSSNRSGKSLKDLPQGTEVLTSALFKQQQALTINDALRNTAGVVNNFGNVTGTNSFRIRGQVASALQNGISSGGSSAAIDTVERLEILKGPAAILAGSNNLGGVVNIVDKRPSAEPVLDLTAQYGTFDEKKVVVDASNALNEDKTLSARIIGVQAGSERSYGGYRGRREEVVAPSLRYKTNGSDIIVGLNATATKSALPNFRIIDPSTNDTFVDVPGRIGPRDQGFDSSVTRFYGSVEQRITSWLTLVGRGTYTRDNLTAAIYAPLGFLDPEAPNELSAFAQSLNNRQRITSGDFYARVKFSTGPLRHTVTAGYNYNKVDFRSFQQDPSIDPLVTIDLSGDVGSLPRPGAATLPSFRLVSQQNDFYVQDFVDIGSLHVLAGARRNRYKARAEFFDVGLGPRPSTGERDGAWTPTFGAVFDVTSDVSIYANYQKGFSPGTAFDCEGNRLPTLTSDNIEGGLKADLFGDRLSTTVSAYRLRQNNVTVSDFACSLPDRFLAQGGLETKGVEFTMNGQVTRGLNVSASYSFADNDFQDPSADTGTVPPLLYRHKYSLYAVYEFQKGALEGLGIGGGVFGNGRTYVDSFGAISLEPQAQLDANLTYRLGKARFNLGVKNLTDRKLNAVTASPSFVPLLEPRTVLASITYSFFQ